MKFERKILQKKDISKIDAEFLKFLQEKNADLFAKFQEFRAKNEELTPEFIIEIGKILDCFFKFFFDITNSHNVFCENLASVKRNFVQRRVWVKYQNLEVSNLWGGLYNFISQDQFISDVLTENEALLEKIEKFTAFVLKTDEGWKKFSNYEVFNLPQAVLSRENHFEKSENLITAKEKVERNGFNLTDNFPKKERIDWNLYYCLLCHNRGKDSCSKGLTDEKHGCPLKQDISESIYVKKEGFEIGAMAIIMRNNPFCIITGRRICNDCELACIFQKQEPVDIQSVETAIVGDVLSLNFGFEIYYLLLLWNPLNIQTMEDISRKTVGIAGAGPAGMFAGYNFAKAGAKVLIFDALNIEISKKVNFLAQNVIENALPLLNEKLEKRTQTNIGGVMEYGITARWNKNYLDLIIAVLLRFGVQFFGATRISALLNYDDIFIRFQFNHFALCVGSATPQLPLNLPNLFTGHKLTNGVMMASDFLMSLHINKKSDDLKKFTQKNVYVLGCGLTAIDTSCEIRALLLQNGVKNPNVKIIYYQEFEKSSAYKTNFLEFKSSLAQGITVLENAKIAKIHKNAKEIIAIENDDGEILPCNLLLIAIGTKPNLAHIQDFMGKNDVSFFGDCNPIYTGSVVKALASVKNGIKNAILQTKENHNIFNASLLSFLQKKVKNIKKIEENLWEIEIFSPILFEKANAGNVLKLQIMGQNSIALTITHKNDQKIYGYLFNTNIQSQGMIEAFFEGKKIHVNGINCTNFSKIDEKKTIIASLKISYILSKIYPKNKIVKVDDFVKYDEKNEYILAIENSESLAEIEKKLPSGSYSLINFQKMNCMLGGICGRCVKEDGNYICV